MLRLTRSQLHPIGIDIGQDSIKMLQLEQVGDSLSVCAAARQVFNAEARASAELRLAAAGDLIRTMLEQGGFAGRSAVPMLPREYVHIKNFRLPVMPASEAESAVLLEARQLFDFDIDDSQVRYLPAGEVRQGDDVLQETIVLAVRNADIANFVELLHRCGLALASLDSEPCALFRSVERFIRRREDEHEVQVLVDLGFSGTRVVIGRGRQITFLKKIDVGGRHLHEAVATRLGVPLEEAQSLRLRLHEDEGADPGDKRDPVRQAVVDATRSIIEQLAHEIALCLRYQAVTFRGQRPTRLRLLGGEARDRQLQAAIAAVLPIPVDVGRPLHSIDSSRMKLADRRGTTGEWAVALGLALRLTEGPFGARDGRPRDARVPQPAGENAWTDPAPAAVPAPAPAPDLHAQEGAHA